MTNAAEPPAPAVDPAALERLIEMTGDANFVAELITSFLTSAPPLLADLRQGLAQGDAPKLRMAAHTLKSTSADFGALTLSGYCKELEALGKAGALAGTEGLIAQVEAEYARVKPALERVQQGAPPTAEPNGSKPEQGRILVVDDYLVNRQKLARLLAQLGHTVTLAEHGRQALDIIAQAPPDLMLLDILMPEMDGYQVLAHLKQHNMLRNLPVIVVSALDEMESVIKCIEMGAEDYLPKPFDPVLLKARISACLEKKRLHDLEIQRQEELKILNQSLEVRNQFIRQTFGRYLSDDIVATILEAPEGLTLGGEKRRVTIMMTDLRGFTAIGERLPAESVVSMLNIYLNVMTEILFKYQGTIDEFIGDAILGLFGAPILRDDDAQRAVACALEMQLAMAEVNRLNQMAGYPEVAMGIGINTGDVVVGNIGSSKRAKYGIVGRHVNLTSRVESYTVGGQIFISESTKAACGDLLRIDGQMEVMPKGVAQPMTIYEVGGIGGAFDIFLPQKEELALTALASPVAVTFTIIEGKHTNATAYPSTLIRMAGHEADMQTERPCRPLTNLKLTLLNAKQRVITEELYVKVTQTVAEDPLVLRIHFTSVPPEADAYLKQILAAQESCASPLH